MNWLDIVLIVIIVVGAYVGLRTGLIGAAFNGIGLVIGVLLAGQLSDDLGGKLTGSISSDTVVTVISYTIIIVATLLVARFTGAMVRKVVSFLFLGFADRLGGLALGAVAGAIVAGALITGMARLTYNFEIPDVSVEGLPGGGAVPGSVIERIPQVADTRGFLEDALTDSSLTSTFIDVTDALPGSALGFVPSDFKTALDILEERIEEEEATEAT